MDLPPRFWAKVDKDGPLWEGTPCWLWTGDTDHGHGRVHYGGRQHPAHRLAYLDAEHTIPAGWLVYRRCYNPLCVNPVHLAVGPRGAQQRSGRASGRFIDLTGQRFGLLIVTTEHERRRGQTYWRCLCDCGAEVWAGGTDLRKGAVTSCGCGRLRPRTDITGQRFGLLVVLSLHHQGRGRDYYWLCRCDCGREVVVSRRALVPTGRKTCGCLYNNDNLHQPWRSNFTMVLYNYRRGARARGHAFALSEEQALALFVQPCHYCGEAPTRTYSEANEHHPFVYNGLDRMDNSQGYTVANVVPCCWTCNQAKRGRSYAEFMGWLRRCAAHLARPPVDG